MAVSLVQKFAGNCLQKTGRRVPAVAGGPDARAPIPKFAGSFAALFDANFEIKGALVKMGPRCGF
jgi:hypothetical protein